MLQISETKEEGVVHLPHIEISRKWRENEELDLHDANVIRPARAPPSPTMVTATAKGLTAAPFSQGVQGGRR